MEISVQLFDTFVYIYLISISLMYKVHFFCRGRSHAFDNEQTNVNLKKYLEIREKSVSSNTEHKSLKNKKVKKLGVLRYV